MAAFDPATIRLQRELLDRTARDLDRDRRLLAKQPKNSKSKTAVGLRERIAEAVHVVADLHRLLSGMQDGTAPVVELDGRAQWIADGRALLDFIEAHPDLPLNLYHSVEISYHPLPNSGNDTDRMAEVNAIAERLGVPVVGPDSGHHYEAEIRFGSAKYSAVAVLDDYRDEYAEIQRLGRAALEQQARDGKDGAR